ncbi:MAG TPA: ABC transporter permease [Candidatus Gemmiger faecigallinarum]|nr:ABC transporter permease [Candidatus Gemmiger faecigallinarum]
MITTAIVLSALELGCIYALVAMALFLSFRVLNIADMTTDGAFTLGCAVSATMAVAGHPVLGLFAAMLAGSAAGFVTSLLQTRLGVPSILAGIITNTGLYTVNLAVMGFSSNVPMLKTNTIFTMLEDALGEDLPTKLLLAALIAAIVCALLILFLGTRLGLSIRATGDNPDMVRASSINTAFTITVGLCIANALTALSGAVLAQYQRSADINLGTGMVVIGLASLIIGETLFGRGGLWTRAVAAVAGSIIYRFIIALAMRANLPSEALKLISAIIVVLAISAPAIKKGVAFQRRRYAAMHRKGGARHDA